MKSLLLQTATRYIIIFQFVLSFFFLLRGHNLPGGGFIGGLLAASGIALYAIAFDVAKAEKILFFKPEQIMGFGLLISISSALISVGLGQTFMKGLWIGEFNIPLFGKVGIGTPFLFDVGVYVVVLGMTVTVIFSLYQKHQDPDADLGEVGS